jgi:hypothetical protein
MTRDMWIGRTMEEARDSRSRVEIRRILLSRR